MEQLNNEEVEEALERAAEYIVIAVASTKDPETDTYLSLSVDQENIEKLRKKVFGIYTELVEINYINKKEN